MARPIIEHPEEFAAETTDPAKRLCLDFFDDVWARGNADRVDAYLARDFSFDAPPGYAGDRTGYGARVQEVHLAFPDLFADVQHIISEDSRVAMRWRMEGHQKGAYLGIAPTGSKVRMEGMSLLTVKDGRIASDHTFSDTLTTLRQMGVLDLRTLR